MQHIHRICGHLGAGVLLLFEMSTWFISGAGESQSGRFWDAGWVSDIELHLSSGEGLALQGPNAVAAPNL